MFTLRLRRARHAGAQIGFTPVERSGVIRGKRTAFTLVELLVVIGIIALLVGILMPSLSRARQEAQRVTCQSNLRQLYALTVIYQGENKNYYPVPTWPLSDIFNEVPSVPSTDTKIWFNALPKFAGQEPMGDAGIYTHLDPKGADPTVLGCPTARALHYQRRTYAMNENLSQGAIHFWVTVGPSGPPPPGIQPKNWGLKPEYLKQLKPLGSGESLMWNWTWIPLYMDGFWHEHLYTPGVFQFVEYRGMGLFAGWLAQNRAKPSNPHNGGMNVVFLDGHVEWADQKGVPGSEGHYLFRSRGQIFGVPSGGITIMW